MTKTIMHRIVSDTQKSFNIPLMPWPNIFKLRYKRSQKETKGSLMFIGQLRFWSGGHFCNRSNDRFSGHTLSHQSTLLHTTAWFIKLQYTTVYILYHTMAFFITLQQTLTHQIIIYHAQMPPRIFFKCSISPNINPES